MTKTQNPLESSDLRFFLTLAQSGSLSRAAQELGVAPSSVSRQLQSLETRLDQTLLRRGKSGILLTPAGQVLREQAHDVLANLTSIEDELKRSGSQSLLRVHGTFGFGRQFLAPAMTDFARLYPQVRLQLELADRDPSLLDDRFDVAVRFGKPPDRAVVAKKLVANRRYLVASPDYARSVAKILQQPSDLQRVRCLSLHQDNDRYSVWQLKRSNPSSTIALRLSPALFSNHGEVVKQWAADGLGIALRSEFDVITELTNGSLVRVLTDWEGSASDIYAMYKTGPLQRSQGITVKFLTHLQFTLQRTFKRL